MFIATKMRLPIGIHQTALASRRHRIDRGVEASLRRLETDQVYDEEKLYGIVDELVRSGRMSPIGQMS